MKDNPYQGHDQLKYLTDEQKEQIRIDMDAFGKALQELIEKNKHIERIWKAIKEA